MTKTSAEKMDDRWTVLSHWDVHDNLSLFSCEHTAFHVSMVMLELCTTDRQPEQCIRSVICLRLEIIKLNTRTHNRLRLLRPRKMSSGSAESMLMARYLIGNQKNTCKN